MKRKLFLVLASLAVALAAAGPARAAYLNLECMDTRQGEYYVEHKQGITYWVDLDKQTITYMLFDNGVLDPAGRIWTYPVQITPAEFNFSFGQWAVSINRLTGDNFWNGPGPQHYVCSKGSRPFPTGKF